MKFKMSILVAQCKKNRSIFNTSSEGRGGPHLRSWTSVLTLLSSHVDNKTALGGGSDQTSRWETRAGNDIDNKHSPTGGDGVSENNQKVEEMC